MVSVGDTRAILGGPDMASGIKVMSRTHGPADPTEAARIRKMGGQVKAFPDSATSAKTFAFTEIIERERLLGPTERVFAPNEWTPGLAVSRAFGDRGAKLLGVSVVPDFVVATTGCCRRALIIASDGVWDVMDDKTAMQLCLAFAAENDAEAASRSLVSAARERWEEIVVRSPVTIDDISAVVVFLP